MNILRAVSGVWWGSHPTTLKLLYNALVRSHLDYGSFLLEPLSKSNIAKLNLIQSQALRIIAGAMKSSPINALQVECVVPPLSLRRQYLADRFLLKAARFSNHPLFPKLTLLNRYVDNNPYWRIKPRPLLTISFQRLESQTVQVFQNPLLPLYSTPYDSVMHRPSVNIALGVGKTSPNANGLFNSIMDSHWRNWVRIFTDASKTLPNGHVGAAFYCPSTSHSAYFRLPKEASVFTGECRAIVEALKYASQKNIPKLLILSDSLSSLQSLLANPFRSPPSVLSLQIKQLTLDLERSGSDVVLAWIPGHSGIIGNEIADAKARFAAVSGDPCYSQNFIDDLLPLARVRVVSDWQRVWEISSRITGAGYFRIQPAIPSKPWFSKFVFTKRETSVVSRMRIGHCCTPVHLARLRLRDSPVCDCGLGDGDLNHLIFA